jgi:integrase
MPLTELQAKNAKPQAKSFKLMDGGGLFLFVQPNGRKLWRMRYHFEGKERLLSFGRYPDVGLAAARERRKQAKASLAENRDPMGQKPQFKDCDDGTFRKVAEAWHKNRETALDAAHSARVWSRLERDVFPLLGSKPLNDISPPDVLAMIRKIEERGALDISRRAKQSVGQVFQFAIACGLASSDPTAHLKGALAPRPRVKHMSRVPLKEVPTLLDDLRTYREQGDRRYAVTCDALMFALLTWVRTKELRFALKSEFEDLDGPQPLWRVSEHRMKMRREHLVPLPAQAAEIARRMVSQGDGQYLFTGTSKEKPISENTMIYALYRLGYHSRQTVHGFRSLASTWANEQLVEFGEPAIWLRRYHEDWVEMQLAHSEHNEVRGAYNAAEYLEPRRRMMQDWADYLDGSKVVDITTGRSRAA